MTFGERLKELREDNDEKQKDIADLLFVSNKVISDYERGIHFPRDERIITTLANHFGVSIDYLFGITNIKIIHIAIDFLDCLSFFEHRHKKWRIIDFMQFLATKNKLNRRQILPCRRIIIFDLDFSLKYLFLFLKQPDNIVV